MPVPHALRHPVRRWTISTPAPPLPAHRDQGEPGARRQRRPWRAAWMAWAAWQWPRPRLTVLRLTLCVALVVPVLWGGAWAGLVTRESYNLIAAHQDLDRVAGLHMIARLIQFDGATNVLSVGWTPVWCQAHNVCEPFEEEPDVFAQDARFNISIIPNRHALHRTDLRIRNTDNPNPSVFNPWQKWGFSYPFDKGIALVNFPQSSVNDTMNIKGVVLSGFLMNVRIGVRVTRMTECLALPNGPCNDLQVIFELTRWHLVRGVVVIIGTVNWIVSIALCIMTALSLFHLLQRPKKTTKHDNELLAVIAAQFGVIFTLPGLRQILPDIPAFGCGFDLVAIVPNLALVAICGSAVLVILTWKRFSMHTRNEPEVKSFWSN